MATALASLLAPCVSLFYIDAEFQLNLSADPSEILNAIDTSSIPEFLASFFCILIWHMD